MQQYNTISLLVNSVKEERSCPKARTIILLLYKIQVLVMWLSCVLPIDYKTAVSIGLNGT